MTIDERLDRLAERHEALAQSLELLALDLRQQTQNVNKLEASTAQNTAAIAQLLDGMRDLVTVARSHDRRI